MNAIDQTARSLDDLAALWMEPTLDVLVTVGLPSVSVGFEIDTWRTLVANLRRELRWRRVFGIAPPRSMNAIRERIVTQTASLLTKTHGLTVEPNELPHRVREAFRSWRPMAAERDAFESVFGRSMPRVFARRTDFTPLLAAGS